MEFLVISGILVCGWVFLSVLGSERERRSAELAAMPPPPAAPANPAGHREKLTRTEQETKV
jgi:hypothetical protein